MHTLALRRRIEISISGRNISGDRIKMKNIMKSIWFEILHSKLLIRIYVAFVFIMGLIAVLNVNIDTKKTGASGMITDNAAIIYEFPIFILALIVGVICGEDYKDKVANYEILSGHSRKSIFFARSLMGIIPGAVLATILCFIPLIVGTLVGGWGKELVLSDVIIREILMFFPMLRLAAFFALLTFLIKNQYIMMAIGFVVSTFQTILNEMLSHSKSVYVSIFNMGLLMNFDGWSIYNVDPASGVVYYNSYVSSVSMQLVIGTIVVSLLMTAFYLFMGYALFRRDELS